MDEYKAFYGRQADAHGADATVAMLATLEACLPAALHSAAYAHLSLLSPGDEARRGLVDAGLAALTEAQALMHAEAKVEAAAAAAVAAAERALQSACHDAKADSKEPQPSASAGGGVVAQQAAAAGAALAEAAGKLAEEAKLEAAVTAALTDAVHALDHAREDAKQVFLAARARTLGRSAVLWLLLLLCCAQRFSRALLLVSLT